MGENGISIVVFLLNQHLDERVLCLRIPNHTKQWSGPHLLTCGMFPQAGTDRGSNHLNRKSNSQSEWTSIVIHLFSSWLTGKTTMEQQFQYDKLDLATKCFLWQTHFLC